MKKLIALIIAIIAMIGMNTANTTKPAEMPVIEATSTVVETVEKEPPESEEPQAEPSTAVTEESKTKPAKTELIITEPKQETKPQTEKPKVQKKETPPAETESTKAATSSSVIRHPRKPTPAALPDITVRDRKRIRSSSSLSRKVANTAAPTVARASMRWMNGDKGATRRANARNTTFTPIRYGIARLAISSAETAETAPVFSS